MPGVLGNLTFSKCRQEHAHLELKEGKIVAQELAASLQTLGSLIKVLLSKQQRAQDVDKALTTQALFLQEHLPTQ